MKREIVINGRFLSRRVTGVERYGREIVRLFRDRFRVEKTRVNGLAGHAWEQFILPAKLNPHSILWSPANSGPLTVGNQALTIHDLSPLEHPEWFRKDFALWYRVFLPMLARRVRVIFTPSEYVRRRVMSRFGVRNVIVTPNGVDLSRFHPGARNTDELPQRYILFVGSLQPRKNLPALLNAWRTIKDEFPHLWLVIAGSSGQVFEKAEHPVEERVHFLGYVAEDALPGLYARAEWFILPSFEEGYGLPVIEAMACGTPVIVSNGGALPEVAGDAGIIFNLSQPEALSVALAACLRDDSLRASLSAKGLAHVENLSWQRTAVQIWEALNEA
ncbi:MAG: glycosyltransferase family 4 protein [Chloroflexota bacterium]|jgi:glycosyltransferase involved in cell wall biosynthesis